MQKMLHPPNAKGLMQKLPEPLGRFRETDWEEVLYRAPPRPLVEPVLTEKVIETSLDNSNLVGNIYFTNYYSWQGHVRDQFMYNLIPEYFKDARNNGELICLDCSVKHLREAMPFDRIVVTMALKSLRKHSAIFYFEYFRLEPDRRRTKLAYGQQHAMWVTRDEKNNPVPAVFPQKVLEAFLRAISSDLN
jgi:acyl-CoA thioesterase FadM